MDKYLRTTVAQLQVMRSEGPAARERLAAVRGDPEKAASARSGGARPKPAQRLWAEFVDASYVRAARKLGYNPAELWYVRHRMSVVGGQLLARRMAGSSDQAASLFRQQAEAMRGTPGVTQAQIDAMLQAAEQAEQQEPPPSVAPRVAQNVETVRRARGGVSDAAWARIAGVAAGAGLSEMLRMSDAQAAQKLDELATLYGQALANREPPPQ